MKKQFYILLSFLALLVFGNVLLLLKCSTKRNVQSDPPPDYYYLTELYQFSIQNELADLRDPSVYIGKDSQKSISLSEIVEKPTLVFRFSGEECNVCIEFVVKELKRTFPDFAKNDRIILLGSGVNARLKENYYGKPVTNLSFDDLGLPFEQYRTPFLFIIDNDKKCKMMFVPDKSFPNVTRFYLETVKERYFESNKPE